jgi:hypothetical protein
LGIDCLEQWQNESLFSRSLGRAFTTSEALDNVSGGAKIPLFSPVCPDMSSLQPQPSPNVSLTSMNQKCEHPRVQIVARDEDAEFVECKECGEVFEASEFKDMAIEENARVREP